MEKTGRGQTGAWPVVHLEEKEGAICLPWHCLSLKVDELLIIKVKQVPVGGKGGRASQFEW